MKQEDKVTNIFEVINRLPEVKQKYALIPPIFIFLGFIPFFMSGIIEKYYFALAILTLVLCPIIMMIVSLEKDEECRRIKMLTVFEGELIVVIAITINLLIYFIFENFLFNLVINLFFVGLRIFKIHRLEKKIAQGTYGYNMDGKVNMFIIGFASYIGARCGIAANSATNPAIRSAYFMLILLLIGDVLLILFAVDPIVAWRIKSRGKRKVKKSQN